MSFLFLQKSWIYVVVLSECYIHHLERHIPLTMQRQNALVKLFFSALLEVASSTEEPPCMVRLFGPPPMSVDCDVQAEDLAELTGKSLISGI